VSLQDHVATFVGQQGHSFGAIAESAPDFLGEGHLQIGDVEVEVHPHGRSSKIGLGHEPCDFMLPDNEQHVRAQKRVQERLDRRFLVDEDSRLKLVEYVSDRPPRPVFQLANQRISAQIIAAPNWSLIEP
jgi:hypothetical protein